MSILIIARPPQHRAVRQQSAVGMGKSLSCKGFETRHFWPRRRPKNVKQLTKYV
jgi:hypothetical protein